MTSHLDVHKRIQQATANVLHGTEALNDLLDIATMLNDRMSEQEKEIRELKQAAAATQRPTAGE